MNNVNLKKGDYIKYYLRDEYIKSCNENNKYYHRNVYLYEVLGIGSNTVTGDPYIIYKAIFTDDSLGVDFNLYCAPLDKFNCLTNTDPSIQTHEFEKCSKFGDVLS